MHFLHDGSKCLIPEKDTCQDGRILGRHIMVIAFDQPVRAFVMRVLHAKRLGLGIHHLIEMRERAACFYSQRHRCIISRYNQHSIQQLPYRQALSGLQADVVAEDPRRRCRHLHFFVKIKMLDYEKRRHQLSD